MPKLEVFYDSQHGQTAAIAEQICDIAQLGGLLATHVCLRSKGIPLDLESQDIVVVGAPIHLGSHGHLVERFVKTHLRELEKKPSFFYSVSLSAAGDTEKNQEDAHRCVREFLEKTGWNPVETVTFAGALTYKKYNPLIRWLMKRIAKKEGGDTDTSRNFEYTDWDAVDAFAQRCVDSLRK